MGSSRAALEDRDLGFIRIERSNGYGIAKATLTPVGYRAVVLRLASGCRSGELGGRKLAEQDRRDMMSAHNDEVGLLCTQ